MFPLESMGETGENVAERYGVDREDQDAFALESQRRRAAAQEAGRFDDEIVAVGRSSSATSTPRPGTTRGEARQPEAGLPARAARSPPATRAASTTAPPRS